MPPRQYLRAPALAAALLGSSLAVWAADPPLAPTLLTWDRGAAARYLDSREAWWQSWDHAQKDKGTYCVSCHTQASYALVRPSLHRDLNDSAPVPAEQAMLDSIRKRVRLWNEVLPFYSDALYGTGKEVESRNAESVLNAVILASYDAPTGHLSNATRLAFDHAWSLQTLTGPDAGSWVWQNFDYAPWESKESQYYWAAQMALTVATALDHYRSDPAAAHHLALLETYLHDHFASQPLVNQLMAARAANHLSGVLPRPQRIALLAEIESMQHADGGWSLTDLGTWHRRDKTPLVPDSDGFATGLVTLVLEESHLQNDYAARGYNWLATHQDKRTGAWPAWSVNKDRDPKSNVGQFMSDAATSYALQALDAKH